MNGSYPAGMIRTVLALTVALTLASGLCLLDRDGDGISDDGMDKCVAHTVAIIAVADVIISPQVRSSLPSAAFFSIPAVLPRLPDPPPKATLLA